MTNPRKLPLGITVMLCLVQHGFASDVNISVRSIHGEVLTGRLTAFSLSEGAVVDVSGELNRVRADEIIGIDVVQRAKEATASPEPQGTKATKIELARGDRLTGRIVEGQSEYFVFEADAGGRLRLSLDALSEAVWPAGQKAAHRALVQKFLAEPPASEDRVLSVNGDLVRGFVTALDQEGLSVDTAEGEVRLPSSVILACRFGGPPPNKVETLHAGITLQNGDIIIATSIEWNAEAMEIRTPEGDRLRLPPDSARGVEIKGGRWEWLTDLKPTDDRCVSLLGTTWPARVNRNVLGDVLRVSGMKFERGLGVHSKSELFYALNKSYEQLVVEFGMDDDSGPFADVTAVIFVDDLERLRLDNVRQGKIHGPFRINVKNARELMLLVDYGKNGDLQDRFDWIQAGLIRASH